MIGLWVVFDFLLPSGLINAEKTIVGGPRQSADNADNETDNADNETEMV